MRKSARNGDILAKCARFRPLIQCLSAPKRVHSAQTGRLLVPSRRNGVRSVPFQPVRCRASLWSAGMRPPLLPLDWADSEPQQPRSARFLRRVNSFCALPFGSSERDRLLLSVCRDGDALWFEWLGQSRFLALVCRMVALPLFCVVRKGFLLGAC